MGETYQTDFENWVLRSGIKILSADGHPVLVRYFDSSSWTNVDSLYQIKFYRRKERHIYSNRESELDGNLNASNSASK